MRPPLRIMLVASALFLVSCTDLVKAPTSVPTSTTEAETWYPELEHQRVWPTWTPDPSWTQTPEPTATPLPAVLDQYYVDTFNTRALKDGRYVLTDKAADYHIVVSHLANGQLRIELEGAP